MEFKEKLARLTEINKACSKQLERNEKIWIQQVNKLYKDIENWFGEYIQERYITVDYELLDYIDHLDEEINKVYLNLGGEQGPSIIFEPTGINIVGAIGKIDLYFRGHKEDGIFLLLIEEDNEQLYWEMRKSRKQLETDKFSKESFEKLIDKWLDKWAEI